MFPPAVLALATQVVEACAAAGFSLVTAESCTGGLIAGALTEVPGSSRAVDRGFVTYSNEAKSEMLGVAPELIAAHGAVSAEVAVAMAQGALNASRALVAVAVTGIAGPDGGTPTKPVGRVHIATASRQGPPIEAVFTFPGDRRAVRLATVQAALEALLDRVRPQGIRRPEIRA